MVRSLEERTSGEGSRHEIREELERRPRERTWWKEMGDILENRADLREIRVDLGVNFGRSNRSEGLVRRKMGKWTCECSTTSPLFNDFLNQI